MILVGVSLRILPVVSNGVNYQPGFVSIIRSLNVISTRCQRPEAAPKLTHSSMLIARVKKFQRQLRSIMLAVTMQTPFSACFVETTTLTVCNKHNTVLGVGILLHSVRFISRHCVYVSYQLDVTLCSWVFIGDFKVPFDQRSL